ncbi:putative RNA recognition motif [Monocercomonoides exilis]|uniref:putative RNA recognition motif n=1 Tax=Monocercomonoides exilis TaxID=2049356 RepID=UPI00355A1AF0|nr:putative RNA recognition motif [Monocercomonoides exilis]|eukprot:MONOS_3672.1-p1 / transcript=MONOS_3672.1 / gene=MONOS_3672 / organism=Monocercomonoides_exilis_PA203 / gene_product=RNA recognition motif / transcript_product=RNA recognition motif / location=Mono_scaffold00089:1664-2673(-) / protein_length=297 / sequence_SO=supercontig / SO=protein_coding / is_pseudo=false
MSSHRLYISNLNQTTRAITVGKLFESVGIVMNATIETEEGLSKGTGYVDMVDAASAEEVRRRFNGYMLEGRKIRVEYSHDKQPQLQQSRSVGPRRQIPRQQQIRPAGSFQKPAFQGAPVRGGFQRAAPRRFGLPPRRRGGFAFAAPPGFGFVGPFAQMYGAPGWVGGFRPGMMMQRGGFGMRMATQQRRPPKPAKRRTVINPDTPTSPTLVFISNLPFSLTSDELKEAFSQYKVKEVTLAHRQFNTMLNVGYGFVDFEDEAEQKKVLEEHPTMTIKGRECKLHAAVVQQVTEPEKQ